MKNRKIYLMGACLLCELTSIAQNVSLQPPPQQLYEQGKTLSLPAIYRIEGEKEANPHAVKALQGILTGKQSTKEGIRIYIGEKGDKSVRKYNKLIPKQEEGYYLDVNDKEIILAGNDERGTYYAIQTFAQLLKEGILPEVEFKDYPAVRYRGGAGLPHRGGGLQLHLQEPQQEVRHRSGVLPAVPVAAAHHPDLLLLPHLLQLRRHLVCGQHEPVLRGECAIAHCAGIYGGKAALLAAYDKGCVLLHRYGI